MPYLRKQFKLPKPDVPVLDGEAEGEKPEIAAALMRKYWGLGEGPISNMVHLLESKGVGIFWLTTNSESIDGFSMWFDGFPFIFLSASKTAGERVRFSLAHELAHLVLHKNQVNSGQAVDDWERIERDANSFASSFHLPSNQFLAECPRYPVLSEFLPLKRRWKVSIQAMIRRGHDLNRFSPQQYKQAYIEISRRHWRQEEPESLPPEESKLHAIIFERLHNKGIGPNELARQLQIIPMDLTSVMPTALPFVQGRLPEPNQESKSDDGSLLFFRRAN